MKKTIIYIVALFAISFNAIGGINVNTNVATNITSDGATLSLILGNADQEGWLDVGFDYGTTSGSLTQMIDVGSSRTDQDYFAAGSNGAWYFEMAISDWVFEPTVTLNLTSLEADTTYYFRSVVYDIDNDTDYYGTELSFTTAAVPEPSTYAAIIGLFSLGFVAYKRKTRNR